MGNAAITGYSKGSDAGRPPYLARRRPGMEGTDMNLQAIETVVRRLFSDAEFRAQVIAEPAAVLDEYRLADSERDVLIRLCDHLASGETVTGKQRFGAWH
jgi:hypothetical protein